MDDKRYKHKVSTFAAIFVYAIFILLLNFYISVVIGDLIRQNYFKTEIYVYMEEMAEDFIDSFNKGQANSFVSNLKVNNIEYLIFNTDIRTIESSSDTILQGESYSIENPKSILDKYIEKSNKGFISYDQEPSIHDELNALVKDEIAKCYLIKKINENQYLILYIYEPQLALTISFSKKFAFISFGITAILCVPIVSGCAYIIKVRIKKMKNYTSKVSEHNFNTLMPKTGIAELDDICVSVDIMKRTLERDINIITEQKKELLDNLNLKKEVEEKQKIFISDVSHEIKTPITIIKGNAEMLYLGLVTEPEEIKEYAKIIMDESNRMDEMVAKLLALTRSENGKLSISFSTFNINTVVEDIAKRFSDICMKENIEIITNLPDNKIMVSADKEAIMDVIMNYVQNAYKYCHKPGHIKLHLHEEGHFAVVTVKNNGPQIPESQQKKIWDRFYKIDIARTRNTTSTGLGLAIVKSIMKQHDMPYGVYNTQDGVAFFIKIRKIN